MCGYGRIEGGPLSRKSVIESADENNVETRAESEFVPRIC